jgi:adenine-specific DNA methylase
MLRPDCCWFWGLVGGMNIERNFNVAFVADMALREKQIQQNYRPVIAVHKWFARRPGTLFRALLLSEFVDAPLGAAFFRSHNLGGIRVADPFMGGGTPLLEANRLGCDVIGYDINPMAYWIVRQEVSRLPPPAWPPDSQIEKPFAPVEHLGSPRTCARLADTGF